MGGKTSVKVLKEDMQQLRKFLETLLLFTPILLSLFSVVSFLAQYTGPSTTTSSLYSVPDFFKANAAVFIWIVTLMFLSGALYIISFVEKKYELSLLTFSLVLVWISFVLGGTYIGVATLYISHLAGATLIGTSAVMGLYFLFKIPQALTWRLWDNTKEPYYSKK